MAHFMTHFMFGFMIGFMIGFMAMLFKRHLQRFERLGHIGHQQNAFCRGVFAHDLQQGLGVRLKHDHVATGFGFEFVQHR